MAGPDAEAVVALTKERVLDAFHSVVADQDRVVLVRARLTHRAVRLAIYLGSADAFEAVDTALSLARRLVEAAPEFAGLRIADFRLV